MIALSFPSYIDQFLVPFLKK